MLSEWVRQGANYISYPLLKTAVEESIKPENPFFQREFLLLNGAISTINSLLQLPSNERDPDLTNIYSKDYPHDELPLLFSWKNRAERLSWTRTLLTTLDTFNREVPGYYTLPESNNPQDVFRFLLLDGYGRWCAQTVTAGNPTREKEEKDRANNIVNALCEGAVVGAEKGDLDMKELAQWMLSEKWYLPKWGFKDSLVERAGKIAPHLIPKD